MASIEKRGTNKWRLTVELGNDSNGDRIRERKSISVEDPALLKTTKRLQDYLDLELAKFKIEVESGAYISPEKTSFASFTDQWKEKFVLTELEYKTQENYLFQLEKRLVPQFGYQQMKDIKTMHLIDFLHNIKRLDGSEKPIGSATKVYAYRVLRSIFSKAKEWRVISDNPMDGVSKPKEEISVELNVYDDKETNLLFRLIQHERPLFRALVSLALTTGMRRAELLGLEWKNIDLDNCIIYIKQSIPAYKDGKPVIKSPKNKGSFRNLSLPSSVVTELKLYKKEWNEFKLENINKWEDTKKDYLFCNSLGKPLYPKRLSELWREFNKRVNDPRTTLRYIRFHDLRHTSATLLISQGIHAKIIAERLGHKKIATTMDVYGHVIRSADQQAASVFDSLIQSSNQ